MRFKDEQTVSAIRMVLDAQHCGHINADMALGEVELLVDMPDLARREPYRSVYFNYAPEPRK